MRKPANDLETFAVSDWLQAHDCVVGFSLNLAFGPPVQVPQR